MENIRRAAMYQCQSWELFMIVDGDDLLIGRQVFALFNQMFREKGLWVMWTNFLTPKGAIGYSRAYTNITIQRNNYRKAGFVMSHLRAYYTQLLRNIKDEDLRDQDGVYFHAANDVAIGLPVLEMSGDKIAYIPEISYYYNLNTGLNNHKVRLKEQKKNDRYIRKQKRY